MKQDLLSPLRAALAALLAFSVLTGIVYPLLVMGLGHAAFAHEARGSLIVDRGRIVGSELIGQAFTSPGYFWSRPSAVSPFPYDAMTSSGSNLGPTNPALRAAARARVQALRDADPSNPAPVPVDLATASSSGLDPHITPAAAYYQAPRVARERGLTIDAVHALISEHTERRTFGILGEPRVKVLALNRALDARAARPARRPVVR